MDVLSKQRLREFLVGERRRHGTTLLLTTHDMGDVERLRRGRDILLFDPVHCYGLPGYLQIIDTLTAAGWPRRAFAPHGGHLFSLHLVAALGLGSAEINPLAFHPFHGPPPALPVNAGHIQLPNVPGIGFEPTTMHGRPSGHCPRRATDHTLIAGRCHAMEAVGRSAIVAATS